MGAAIVASHKIRPCDSAIAWSLRTLGTVGCLGGALVFSLNGFPDTALVLVLVALAVSLIGGIREFWRGSDYYLQTDPV